MEQKHITLTIHVWYIYLHLVEILLVKSGKSIGKYTSPMDDYWVIYLSTNWALATHQASKTSVAPCRHLGAMVRGEVRPSFPMGSMYAIFTYIWLILMVNVGLYTIHGFYGFEIILITLQGMDTYPTKREVWKIIDSNMPFFWGGYVIVPWRVFI